MSEMEQWKGTLEKIDLPEHLKTWQDQVDFLKKRYHIEVYDWEKESISFKESECIFLNNQWFKIEKEMYDDYGDIFNATEGKDGTINFVLKYYNGGCCFDEALEIAVDKLIP